MAEARRRFKFLKEIAQGGFGKVYLAEMMTGDNFSSVCAVKVLHARWSENAEVVMRSRDEARLLGRLRHRNIVRVESLTRIQGQVTIVMEYLEGADLKSVMGALRDQGRAFPRQAAFEIIGQIGSALDAAYNQVPLNATEPLQVIHRDIKPSNAMVTVEGDVKVLDFGTARASFEHREAKTQALSFGSAAYMAPERLMGEEDTPAADVFSLGITLYELLALDSFGKISARPEKFERVLDERLASLDLSALSPEVAERASAILRRMLAYDAAQRLTAAEVIDAMEALADECRDGGLKRLAREVVRGVVTAQVPEPDPEDPLNGATVFEDTSTVDNTDFTATADGWVDSDSEAVAPSAADRIAAAPHIPAPHVSAPRALPTPPVEPPPPPPRTFSAPTFIPDDDPAVEPTTSNAPVPNPAPVLITASGPPSAPSIPFDASPAPVAPRSNTGMVVGVVAVLLLAVAGGAAFLVGGADKDEQAGTTTPSSTPSVNPALRPGDEAADFAAPAAGKGAAVLTVPAGASEVGIRRSGTTLKVEWDGTKHLNLRDLDAGTYVATVKPTGGGAGQRADFAVKEGVTCAYRFDAGAGAWQEAECR